MSTEEPKSKKKNILIYNILFIVICAGLFLFLWNAPEESTTFLPNDEDHAKFMKMNKKEAEKFCEECHYPEGEAPLPENHPPKYRCLFCHKRN
jgi:hypothetical protein